MIDYKRFFTDRVPSIIHNLSANCADENTYLTLDDLKRRARHDLYVICRAVQRFLITMSLDSMNRPLYSVQSRMLWLDNRAKETFNRVNADDVQTVSALKNVLDAFSQEFEGIKDSFVELINYHNDNQIRSNGYTDIERLSQLRPLHIPSSVTTGLTHTGSFVNMFVPFDEFDNLYANTHQMILELKRVLPIHMYGFSDHNEDWSNNYYRYLENEWSRCDIRYGTFDAVFLSFATAFNSSKPGQYKRAYNYIKPGGTLIIYGMRSDFIPSHIEKLVSTLTDISVRSFTHNNFLQDDPSCKNDLVLVVGRKANVTNWFDSYKLLLGHFLTGCTEYTPYSFTGSTEDVTPFRSYELTENEYEMLKAALTKTEQGIMNSIFPKKIKDTRRPLLPFSSGQLGLVLISGDVNGIVEEKESHCRHTVKGYSSRRTSSRTEPILNTNGVQTGYKNITVDYPVTNVDIIMPNGNIVEIGG